MLEVSLIVEVLARRPDLVGQMLVVVEIGKECLTILTPDAVLLRRRPSNLAILKRCEVLLQFSQFTGNVGIPLSIWKDGLTA